MERTLQCQRVVPGLITVRSDGRTRTIIFGSGVYWNVVLRQVHDAFFGPPDPRVGVHFITMLGAHFVSSNVDRPALRTGVWP